MMANVQIFASAYEGEMMVVLVVLLVLSGFKRIPDKPAFEAMTADNKNVEVYDPVVSQQQGPRWRSRRQ